MKKIREKLFDTWKKNERDKKIIALWREFEDVPLDPKTETIQEDFFIFPAGTERIEIWKWFDSVYSKGVVSLLYGIKR